MSYTEKTYEDVKRDWDKLKEDELIKKLKIIEACEDKNRKIKLKKSQKFVQHHSWNLFFNALFLYVL